MTGQKTEYTRTQNIMHEEVGNNFINLIVNNYTVLS
jgi:hypothetical protein